VWLGQLGAADVADVLGHDDSLEHARAARGLEQLISHYLPDDCTALFEHTIEHWPGGYDVGMRYGVGLGRGFVILRSNRPDQRPESGAVTLHDPRAGAANVGLPGLPWGRPIKMEALPGRAVVMPGWLSWSVAPLYSGSQYERVGYSGARCAALSRV